MIASGRITQERADKIRRNPPKKTTIIEHYKHNDLGFPARRYSVFVRINRSLSDIVVVDLWVDQDGTVCSMVSGGHIACLSEAMKIISAEGGFEG